MVRGLHRSANSSHHRTRARTWDPLIKRHQIALIYQAYFDISFVRSGLAKSEASMEMALFADGSLAGAISSQSEHGQLLVGSA
jgi:hypothetical protein